jgi:nicotinate-nucleotide adenylyltransferase
VGGAALGGSLTGSAGGGVGVMGGTFDPVHLGHLAVAEEAREALGLASVLFVPAGVPPHKPVADVTRVEDRVTMVELGIADNPAFRLSRVEVDREGPSFTVDTLEALADAERAAGRESALTLILSAETFAGLPAWRDPHRLFELARVAVVPRSGHQAPDDAWLDRHFPGAASRVVRLDGPILHISSTAIRDRLAAGRSIRYLVPDAVARYIGDHGLYQSPRVAASPQEVSA